MYKKIIGIFIVMLIIGLTMQTMGMTSKVIIPDDPEFSSQWHLDNIGQTGGTFDTDIDAPEAWEIQKGSSDIIIAICDSGVDYTHPDLADNIWNNTDEIVNGFDSDGNGFIDDIRGWDFINNDNDPMDDLWHGTRCAGIACAVSNNNLGVAGVCWNCKIMPIKMIDSEGWETDEAAANGIIYAVNNGADIISMSWGGLPSYPLTEDALNYAASNGVILIAAAGNSDSNADFYPAGFDNVISVAATDNEDKKFRHSNWGDWIDIAAPGDEIYTTTINGDYDFLSATSAATPIVAGVAGLILSRSNRLSPSEVKSIICENVDPYDSEYYIGTGRVNAYKALSAINTPPDALSISGKTNGKAGVEYEYCLDYIMDPEGDNLNIWWDWGDDINTGWLGPYDSGEPICATHSWSEEGTYTIKAKLKDPYGAESNWASLEVSMPKNKAIITSFFLQRLIYRFPLFERILNQII